MKLNHEEYMNIALEEAQKAALSGEVPVGAILVSETGEILARGHNLTEIKQNCLEHAEIVVLNHAMQTQNTSRLVNTTLYVTLEPCFMCAGAIVHSRISRVVFGAWDPKGGACETLANVLQHEKLNHKCDVISGVLETECAQVLKSFFKERRKTKANK